MKNTEKFGVVCLAPFLATLGIAAVTPSAAHAQENAQTLNEVVVTAERRTSNVQKTAAAVSVRDGDDLQAEGKYSLANILEGIPGSAPFSATQFGGGSDTAASQLNIRGIPSNGGVGGAALSVPSSAAIYVDGVYEGVGGGYDIDRVEVLKGPQGTLYGRSATSGVVAIHTRDPKLGEFGGNVSAETGNYDLRHFEGALNIPLGDKAALRISGNSYLRDGFGVKRDLTYANNKDWRVKFLAEPTDNFSVLVGATGQDNVLAGGGLNTYFTSPDTYRFEYVNNGTPVPSSPGTSEYRQYWAEINWDLGFATLTYQPAYRSFNNNYTTKIRALPTFNSDSTITTPKDDIVTHELRFASEQDSKLTWLVGTLLFDNELHNDVRATNVPSGSLRSDTDTHRNISAWGVFAEATYPIADSWRITGGVRYDDTKVAVTQTLTNNSTGGLAGTATTGFPENLTSKTLTGPEGERTFTSTTYKARIEHDLAPANMIYAMVSTAASPGFVTLTTDATNTKLISQELGSETNTAYEIGSKNRFLDNMLQVNASVYFNKYGGYQTLGINVNPVPPPAGNSVFATLVAPMEVVGAELEVQLKPWANGIFDANLAYTNSRFSDRSTPTAFGTTFGTYFADSAVPGIIPFTAQLAYDHTIHVAGTVLTLGGDVRYNGPYNVDRILASQMANTALAAQLLPYIRSDAYEVYNLHGALAFADGKYSISGWVRNVGGDRHKTSATGVMNVSPTATGPTTNMNAALTAPRTWGVSLNAKF